MRMKLLGLQLCMESYEIKNEMDFVLHFLPVAYIKNVVISATNAYAKKSITSWKDMDFDEFLHVIEIFLAMEVHEIHGPRRLYWSHEQNRIFSSMNFGEIISCKWFESIIANLQLSLLERPDQHVLDFLDAVNTQFKQAITPGSFITLGESKIKSFQHDLKGKIKIICKLKPIGNETKNMSDGVSKIVLHLELYEGRDIMCDKKYVKEFGATTATLQLTEAYHGLGRRVIADSWFGSAKCAKALMERGLYSIMLVKTAYKDFPRELLSQNNLQRGEWNAVTAEIDDVELQAQGII